MGLLEVFPEITWLPVVLFVVGVILMAIEMVVPGFGVFGISGLILLCLSVILTAQTFWQALILIAIIACVLGVLFAVLVLLASTGNMPKGLVLRASARRELGYSSAAGAPVPIPWQIRHGPFAAAARPARLTATGRGWTW